MEMNTVNNQNYALAQDQKVNDFLDPSKYVELPTDQVVKEYGCNFAFGLLQMRLGIQAHADAEAKLEEIKKNQRLSSDLTELVVNARNYKNAPDDQTKNQCEAKIKELLAKQEIASFNFVWQNNADKIEDFVASVSAQQSEINNDNNTKMTQLQDYSSQYNSMISGANNTMKKISDLMSKFAQVI